MRQVPEFVPILARWFENEWASWGDSFQYGLDWLTASLEAEGSFPLTLVACLADKPVGTARIMSDQIPERPQFNPWFCYWYTLPEYRGQGIGACLDQERIVIARNSGLTKVYLNTSTQEEYRKRHGWKSIERLIYEGVEVAIMSLDL
ncbi:GNAT family N-acetyltransferase [Leptolyngbya sp. 'hensonii']|uniref:GNAT family N-acetyltransferase n=1 Tax=Leptolyngbya sp. 'hensonii' TaxID=1922337 RepID=UPI00094FED9E|nr:GNAT family N-acetyltransferase [Leptolyngbya sp. 'hensonii']